MEGKRIMIRGRVRDAETGAALPYTLMDFWQASPANEAYDFYWENEAAKTVYHPRQDPDIALGARLAAAAAGDRVRIGKWLLVLEVLPLPPSPFLYPSSLVAITITAITITAIIITAIIITAAVLFAGKTGARSSEYEFRVRTLTDHRGWFEVSSAAGFGMMAWQHGIVVVVVVVVFVGIGFLSASKQLGFGSRGAWMCHD